MRNISAALQNHFTGSVLTLAYCIRLERKDGEVFLFTSNNRPMVIEGETYSPAEGLTSSAVRTSETTGVDNFDTKGIITDDRITDTDLLAGKYDNARVRLFVVNYANLAQGSLVLLAGYIGEIQFSDGMFNAEVRSLFQKLGQQVGQVTSAGCRVKRFGDFRCKKDLTELSFPRVVAVVTSTTVLRFSGDAHATDTFTNGELEMRSGPNKGEWREIKAHALSGGQAVVTLHLPFPFAVTAGDVGVLTAGCDRSVTACVGYDNIVNFRGEPYIPGTDLFMKRGRK
jgi:uncharacterized phage protein (TIGR02218 family)